MVVPFGMPARLSFSVQVNTFPMIVVLFVVSNEYLNAGIYVKIERSSFCPTYIRLKVPDFTDGQRKTIPQKMYKSPYEVVTGANIKKSFERTNG